MELQFSKNLVRYRKSCGLTQGQLAAKLNVTPQAVSKWENGSLPDSELLPKISGILGVSLDVLFGIKQEQAEQDLEQLIIQKIRQTPPKDRADLILKLHYTILSAYNDYTLSAAKYPENLELETYAELRTDYECSIARLNDDLKYCFFLKTPENGVNSYTEPNENMIYLFQTLANKDAIEIVHYLGSGFRNRMQSLDYISKQVNIPVNRVKKIMDNLDRLGIVWRVSADISDTPTIIYGYSYNTPLTCLLVIAESISRYIRFHDLFIDQYSRGPFRYNAPQEQTPVPEVSFWNNADNSNEEE